MAPLTAGLAKRHQEYAAVSSKTCPPACLPPVQIPFTHVSSSDRRQGSPSPSPRPSFCSVWAAWCSTTLPTSSAKSSARRTARCRSGAGTLCSSKPGPTLSPLLGAGAGSLRRNCYVAAKALCSRVVMCPQCARNVPANWRTCGPLDIRYTVLDSVTGLQTPRTSLLLASGWWGSARHLHYVRHPCQ